MLKRLRLRNFKAWKDTGDIRCAPITGLFGTNSSGKSSLLHLLLLLKQTADSPDRSQVLDLGDERSLVELGTYAEIIHGHDTTQVLQWELEWSLPKTYRIEDPAAPRTFLISGDEIGFSAEITAASNGTGPPRPAVRRFQYEFGMHRFGMRQRTTKDGKYDLFHEGTGFKFSRMQGRAWPLPAPAKCYGFPDQVRAYYQNAGFLSDLELQLEQLFARVHYLGPLRDFPKRQYSWAGAHPADMGRRGEKVVDALLASREDGATISPGYRRRKVTVEERVAYWLKELGLITGFEVRPIGTNSKLFQVWVKRSSGSSEVLVTDVGFGVSQILPVLALCYYAPEGSVILLEQPEIHLHPAVQAGLADVLIDATRNHGVQIIVESHSEHLLRRLQLGIAEERLAPDDVSLMFCDSGADHSTLKPLEIDLYGNVTNWPEGFFGDEYAELARMQTAIQHRKRGAVE